MIYNANTINGRDEYLFPIPTGPGTKDVEVFITFRNEVHITTVKNFTDKFLWLRVNEYPDEFVVHTKSIVEVFHRLSPTVIHRVNLIQFLELLSLRK